MQGRITCKNGSHQTDPDEIVSCRTSRWLSGCILSMDLSQIELRVAALLSGEPSMVDAYNLDWDLHSRRAISLWGMDYLEAKYPTISTHAPELWKKLFPGFGKLERDVDKHVNFADLFWASSLTMQNTVLKMSGRLVPLSIFQKAEADRPITRPVLFEWQRSLIRLARQTSRISLPITGQSRTFMGGDDFEDSEIINFPVQTTAGNLMLRLQHKIICLIDEASLSSSILTFLNVYDALYFDLTSPLLIPHLRRIIDAAFSWVITNDYWFLLCSHYGRSVKLDYELSKPY